MRHFFDQISLCSVIFPLNTEIKKTNRCCRIILQENDNCYTSVCYPLNIPNLVRNNFFWFPNIKQKLRGKQFPLQNKPLMYSKTLFCRCHKRNRHDVVTLAKVYILRRKIFQKEVKSFSKENYCLFVLITPK